MSTLILIRHGQSQWNLENRFTGWIDVPLSDQGKQEALRAGQLLKDKGLTPEVVHTSLLDRAIQTSQIALDELERSWIPVRRSWRLNERHYGALQGLNKAETAEKYGDEQVRQWRRSYDITPPLLDENDPTNAVNDQRYSNLPISSVPRGESLQTVVQRVVPYWEDAISTDLKKFGTVLIVAHGNSLRALAKHIENISDEDIMDLELGTGEPRIYGFSEALGFGEN